MRSAFILFSLLSSAALAYAEPAQSVASGDFYAPRFSPDGTSLLVSGERMRGLAQIDLPTGAVRHLLDTPGVGGQAGYLPDGRVHFEAKRAGKMRELVLDAHGLVEEIERPEPIAFSHRNRIYLRTPDGLVSLGSGDRFFGPVVSPDKSKVAFTGLATGIYVYDIRTGRRLGLGPGTAPSWSPDSATLAYERTEDDGHQLLGSEIWLWNEHIGARNLTQSDAVIERRPAWAPDGKRIAFDDDRGSVYIVSAEVGQ